MFYCERCATRFNAAAASSASNCPRCRARDGVAVPLSFRLFEVDDVRSVGVRPRQTPPAPRAPAAGDRAAAAK
jgi:PHP family Zn ribbon phosphoesterase